MLIDGFDNAGLGTYNIPSLYKDNHMAEHQDSPSIKWVDSASTFYIGFDPVWNPKMEEQATYLSRLV